MENPLRYLILILLVSCSSFNSKKTPFDIASVRVCDFLNTPNIESYQNFFSPEFLKAVPYEKITPLVKYIHDNYGKCESIKKDEHNGLQGTFVTRNEKALLDFSMVVDESAIIKGLLFKSEYKETVEFKNKTDVLKELEKLQGSKALYFGTTNAKQVSYAVNENLKQPLASVFKIYVLIALAEKMNKEKLSWEYKIPIEKRYKSLPSGVMQNQKNGDSFTLFEFATKMISISDNTATDHLIHFVGREKIERLIREKGLSKYHKEMTPFLTTKELFAVRAYFNDNDVKKYLAANRSTRLEMIRKVSTTSHEKLLKELENWSKPKHPLQIEWFATAKDICKTFDILFNEYSSKELRAIMSMNTPFVNLDKNGKWNYVGYKGGSERGVLQLAYYLEDKNKEQMCLYVGQYDEEKPFFDSELLNYVKSLLMYLDKQ